MYLSDSFANLPSPVNETSDLKQLFKAKDNEDDLNRNGKRDKAGRDSNVEIRIEGKDHSPVKVNKTDDSMDKKAQANINVKDIEKIVFDVYGKSVLEKNQVVQAKDYVEEESYVNPSNADYIADPDYEDQRLKSLVTKTNFPSREPIQYKPFNDSEQSEGTIGRDTIKLNYNEIFLDNRNESCLKIED